MTDDGLLGRAELERAFAALSTWPIVLSVSLG
jgi:hypothetical protein